MTAESIVVSRDTPFVAVGNCCASFLCDGSGCLMLRIRCVGDY